MGQRPAVLGWRRGLTLSLRHRHHQMRAVLSPAAPLPSLARLCLERLRRCRLSTPSHSKRRECNLEVQVCAKLVVSLKHVPYPGRFSLLLSFSLLSGLSVSLSLSAPSTDDSIHQNPRLILVHLFLLYLGEESAVTRPSPVHIMVRSAGNGGEGRGLSSNKTLQP